MMKREASSVHAEMKSIRNSLGKLQLRLRLTPERKAAKKLSDCGTKMEFPRAFMVSVYLSCHRCCLTRAESETARSFGLTRTITTSHASHLFQMLKHVHISPLRNRSDSMSLRSSVASSCSSSLCGSPEPPVELHTATPSRSSSYSSLNESIPQVGSHPWNHES